LGNVTASSGTIPNPFTFQGWQFDSQTGYYYTGSGFYDPATGQGFGCHDKGPVDPGEDLCREDEPLWCHGVCNDKNPYYAALTSGQVVLLKDDHGGDFPISGGGGGGGGDEEGGDVRSAPAAIPEQARYVYEYVLSHDL